MSSEERKMYNPSQKDEYLKESVVRNEHIESNVAPIFKHSKEMEERLGKDIANFSVDEIFDYYCSLFSHSITRLRNINSQLKFYTDWCIAHKLVDDCQNHFDEIDTEMLMKCVDNGLRENKIITREELVDYLKKEKMETRTKVLALAIFEGLYDKSILTLRTATLKNLNGNIFTMADGYEIRISNYLRDLMIESANTYVFETSTYSMHYDDTPNIVKKRPSKNKELTPHMVTIILGAVGNPAITIRALCESGKLHYVKKIWATGEYDDLRTLLHEHNKDIVKMFGNNNINDFIIMYGKYFSAE